MSLSCYTLTAQLHGFNLSCLLQSSPKGTSEATADWASWSGSEVWSLDTSAGPRFAALNGDINLIHLSPTLARLFGFPSNIAHGVFLVSRSIAAIQRSGLAHTLQTPTMLRNITYFEHQQKQHTETLYCNSSLAHEVIVGLTMLT